MPLQSFEEGVATGLILREGRGEWGRLRQGTAVERRRSGSLAPSTAWVERNVCSPRYKYTST
eukprot:3407119-Pleurochrysis_carterae.AAC.1